MGGGSGKEGLSSLGEAEPPVGGSGSGVSLVPAVKLQTGDLAYTTAWRAAHFGRQGNQVLQIRRSRIHAKEQHGVQI